MAVLTLLALVLLVLCVYFFPTIVACNRSNNCQHAETSSIVILNIFLGWTLVGWVVALAWACSSNTKPKQELPFAKKIPKDCNHKNDLSEIIKNINL